MEFTNPAHTVRLIKEIDMAIRYGHTFDLAFTVYTSDPDWETVTLDQMLTSCEVRLRNADLEAFGYEDTIEFDDAEEA